jgi:hypothetical protein
MKWIEIIEVRVAGNAWNQVDTHMQEFMDQVEQETGKSGARMYTSMMLDTDLSIHLFHDSGEAEIRKSSLGFRLVSALKSFGLVNHTIWIERSRTN